MNCLFCTASVLSGQLDLAPPYPHFGIANSNNNGQSSKCLEQNVSRNALAGQFGASYASLYMIDYILDKE